MDRKNLIGIFVTLILIFGFTMQTLAAEQEKPEANAVLEAWFWKSFVKEQNEYLIQQFKNFEAETGVKVNASFLPSEEIYRKQLAAVEAKTFPDVSEIWANNVDQFNRMGMLLDIDDVFESLNAKSPLSKLLSTMVTIGGKKVGIPLHTSAEAHYWRKDILDELGLKIPQNWEELKTAAKKITDAGAVYGFSTALGRPATDGEKFIQTVLWSQGGSIVDANGNLVFKSPATVKAYDYIADLYREKIMPPGITSWDDGGNNRAYQTGAVAGIQNTASVYNYMNKNDQELLKKTVIVPIAAGPNGRFTDTVPHAVGININTKFPKAAKALVKYIMDANRYQGWIEEAGGQIQPVYPELVSHPFWKDPYRKAFIEMGAKYGVYQGWPGPSSAARGEVFGSYVLSDTMQKILIDKWPTEKAIDWGNKKIKEIYEGWK